MSSFSTLIQARDTTMVLAAFSFLLACAYPLGLYIARVYQGERMIATVLLGWLERFFYKISGVDPAQEMTWKKYALSLLAFSFIGFLFLYAALRGQRFLAHAYPALTPDLAFNTAISFMTNTNWQAYVPETMMSPVLQMGGLAVQNFLSCAVGMSVLAALSRGFARKKAETIGNFWVDLTRSTLYVLLPLSFVLALVLASQGVVQSFTNAYEAQRIATISYTDPQTQNQVDVKKQIIPLGPVASQIAIKQLGANGGGYYNANAAHPIENPNGLTNFLEFIAILLIPVALCISFGRMVGDKKQGLAILAAMLVIFLPLMFSGMISEQKGNPYFPPLGVDQQASAILSGGNMEGKETRIGAVNSAIWAAATTASSNGSTNAAHDSMTPLGGFVPLLMMQFGDVVFGGAGTGFCSMIVFVILSVFVAGLMVGRTPEYLGKKIGPFDMKMVSLAVLFPHIAALTGTAIAVVFDAGKIGATNPYAQGFSEILYAFSSASNNNGSAFGGLAADTPFYNTALALAMLVGRFFVIIPMLALAGSMASKNMVPTSVGTLKTTTPLFVMILVSIIVLVGVLTFVPALALGPVAEHFHLLSGF